MAGTNQYLSFASASGSLTLNYAAWNTYAARQQGFQIGEVDPEPFNTVLRQAVMGTAVLGQVVCDYANVDAVDDGSVPAFEANLRIALAAMLAGAFVGVDASQTPNVVNVALSPQPPALNQTFPFFVKVANTNTGPVQITLATASAPAQKNLTRRDGSALQSGDLIAGVYYHVLYDSTLGAFRVLGSVNSDAAGTTTVITALRGMVPIYPEILTPSNAFSISSGAGSVSVDAGQAWSHRGVATENTSNYQTRSFTTVASKTYHLRWQWNGGSKQFVLKDLADASYNPNTLPENAAVFDTTYDDMLVARVVTDGSNNIAVTPLKNRVSLLINSTISANNLTRATDSSGLFMVPFSTLPLNWARRPASFVVTASLVSASGTTSTYLETITYYSGTFTDGSGTVTASLDRYGMTAVGVMQTRVASSSITGSWTSIQTGSA